MDSITSVKLCKCCSVELVLGQNFTQGQHAARSYRCRSCMSDIGKRWFRENKEKAIESGRRRRKNSPDEVKAYRAAYYATNKEKWRAYHNTWRKGRQADPIRRAKALCTWTRVRAKARGIKFDLTSEFLSEKLLHGRCEASGVEFFLGDAATGRKRVHPYAPSIDRINPELGYVQTNVRVVAYIYNCMKSEYSDQTALDFARRLISHHEQQERDTCAT